MCFLRSIPINIDFGSITATVIDDPPVRFHADSQEDGRATPPTKTSVASDHQYYTDITQGRRFVAGGRPPFLA